MIVSSCFLTPLGEVLAVSTSQGICFLEFTDVTVIEQELSVLLRYLGADIKRSVQSLGGATLLENFRRLAGLGEQGLSDDMRSQVAHIQHLQQELSAFFAGELRQFSVPLALYGTAFQLKVWRALLEIPYGQTCSYQSIAERIGQPTAMRAVAAANGQNPVSILVSCHRVIGKSGRLVGYSGGLWRKECLLALEAPSMVLTG